LRIRIPTIGMITAVNDGSGWCHCACSPFSELRTISWAVQIHGLCKNRGPTELPVRSFVELHGATARIAEMEDTLTRAHAAVEDPLTKKLADEYLHLGGKRLLVMDDNDLTTRSWEPDAPEADAFWKQNIQSLPDKRRTEVLSYLPSINAT
jgi:hypothetical protein